ncbi:hypothetical protein NIES2104_04730 [Leptolyngbya sp. NIES-2104]|nr:hypothetical protein NIES2104_04730 [Leptolyngbya sp. NIES-2104]
MKVGSIFCKFLLILLQFGKEASSSRWKMLRSLDNFPSHRQFWQ